MFDGVQLDEEDEKLDYSEKQTTKDDEAKTTLTRSHSVPSWKLHVAKVDKVYTVGCFDLFHEGHRLLLERLGALGKQVRILKIAEKFCLLKIVLHCTS